MICHFFFFFWFGMKHQSNQPHRSLNIRPTEIPLKCSVSKVFSGGHTNQVHTSCDVQTIGDFFFSLSLSFFFLFSCICHPKKRMTHQVKGSVGLGVVASTLHPNSCQSASRSPPVPCLMENSNACCLLGALSVWRYQCVWGRLPG